MPHDFRQRVWLVIIGTISSNYPIFANMKELGLEDRIIVTGFIPHKELHNYYAAADLNILASHDEGFGLSIIEGFVYGVPSVTFSDLDAISDLYDEKAMVLCDERTDEAFSKKIRFALEKQWDREAIKEYSKKFSMESMTEKYISVFKQEIAKHNCKKLPA
jgi:glycosyltransferase involved in cell wall biosynthesis